MQYVHQPGGPPKVLRCSSTTHFRFCHHMSSLNPVRCCLRFFAHMIVLPKRATNFFQEKGQQLSTCFPCFYAESNSNRTKVHRPTDPHCIESAGMNEKDPDRLTSAWTSYEHARTWRNRPAKAAKPRETEQSVIESNTPMGSMFGVLRCCCEAK